MAKYCEQCDGTGRIESITKAMTYYCPRCNGTGLNGSPRALFFVVLSYFVLLAGLTVLALSI